MSLVRSRNKERASQLEWDVWRGVSAGHKLEKVAKDTTLWGFRALVKSRFSLACYRTPLEGARWGFSKEPMQSGQSRGL